MLASLRVELHAEYAFLLHGGGNVRSIVRDTGNVDWITLETIGMDEVEIAPLVDVLKQRIALANRHAVPADMWEAEATRNRDFPDLSGYQRETSVIAPFIRT